MSDYKRVSSVLFVCLGNICRSPTAEAVFRHKAAEAGLDVRIDSAGTHGYHIGKSPDQRSQAVGEERGYSFAGLRCRRVESNDFDEFDLILAMDESNLENLRKMASPTHHDKIQLFLTYGETDEPEVPDPYYGGRRGFDLVLDLIEDASDGLISHIQNSR
ncbi:low molecular weight protein-tyrosine-phosphatase [Alteromonas sp. CYL-A6]|uniref:low molecular weight protein-tyrosine-phosphatase n=1 Tax=Alteromonas nitratireducens TaxID=3390813 RepID=UPI0034B24B99